METIQACIQDISKSIGQENVSLDKATRLVYRTAHGPESLLHESLDDFTPALVTHPKNTEDVVAIVNLANKYGIPLIPQGGRTGTYGAESIHDGIVIDTAPMDKILEFDKEAYRITLQAGIRVIDLMNFLAQNGYSGLEYPAMWRASTLGARAAVSGYNKYENRWGGSRDYIKGLEVVLANGDVVEVGKGNKIPAKSSVGLDMMSMFIGSKGTLGVITKVTENFIPTPPGYVFGSSAFHTIEDGLRAYIELKSPINASAIWRTKAYHKIFVSQAVKLAGFEWPDDAVMMTEYHILGEPDVVEAMKKRAELICKNHNGFWRDDMPPNDVLGKVHETPEKYIGMAAIQSDRIVNGGMGNRLVAVDPVISNTHLIDFFKDCLQFLKQLENGTRYPNLSKRLHVLSPGDPGPLDHGWSKVWTLMVADSKNFDRKTREEFVNWYRDWAEIVWHHGGSVSGTHAYIPRELEIEFTIKEVGEMQYKLMKTIKDALDPKHIMNPNVRF